MSLTIHISSGHSIPPPPTRPHAASPNSYVLFQTAEYHDEANADLSRQVLQAGSLGGEKAFCTKVKFSTSTPLYNQTFTLPPPTTPLILRFVVMDRSASHSDTVIGSSTALLATILESPGKNNFRLKKGFSKKLLTDRHNKPSYITVTVTAPPAVTTSSSTVSSMVSGDDLYRRERPRTRTASWAAGVLSPPRKSSSFTGAIGPSKSNPPADPLHTMHTRQHPGLTRQRGDSSAAGLRRRLLLRSFMMVDGNRRGWVSVREVIEFGRWMGKVVTAVDVGEYAGEEVWEDDEYGLGGEQLGLTQEQFVAFGGRHVDCDDAAFVGRLEGFLEGRCATSLRRECLGCVFEGVVRYMYLKGGGREEEERRVILDEFGKVFEDDPSGTAHGGDVVAASAYDSLDRELATLHPVADLMLCTFEGFFLKASRGVSDDTFTTVVDEFYEGWEEKVAARMAQIRATAAAYSSPAAIPSPPSKSRLEEIREMKELESLKLKVLEAKRAAAEAEMKAQEMKATLSGTGRSTGSQDMKMEDFRASDRSEHIKSLREKYLTTDERGSPRKEKKVKVVVGTRWPPPPPPPMPPLSTEPPPPLSAANNVVVSQKSDEALDDSELNELLTASLWELEAVLQMSTKNSTEINEEKKEEAGLKTFHKNRARRWLQIDEALNWWGQKGTSVMLKEFGFFMMRSFSPDQIRRCFSKKPFTDSGNNINPSPRDSAIELCVRFFDDMPDELFVERLRKYNLCMKVRAKHIHREELLERVLKVLTCHRSGNINSQELFCFGRCVSSALAMTTTLAGRPQRKKKTFEWEDTQTLLEILNGCGEEEMRSAQFFGCFGALCWDLEEAEFEGSIERFMALANSTFDDLRKEEGRGAERETSFSLDESFVSQVSQVSDVRREVLDELSFEVKGGGKDSTPSKAVLVEIEGDEGGLGDEGETTMDGEVLGVEIYDPDEDSSIDDLPIFAQEEGTGGEGLEEEGGGGEEEGEEGGGEQELPPLPPGEAEISIDEGLVRLAGKEREAREREARERETAKAERRRERENAQSRNSNESNRSRSRSGSRLSMASIASSVGLSPALKRGGSPPPYSPMQGGSSVKKIPRENDLNVTGVSGGASVIIGTPGEKTMSTMDTSGGCSDDSGLGETLGKSLADQLLMNRGDREEGGDGGEEEEERNPMGEAAANSAHFFFETERSREEGEGGELGGELSDLGEEFAGFEINESGE